MFNDLYYFLNNNISKLFKISSEMFIFVVINLKNTIMKPIKSLLPLAIWLMRIGLLIFAYTHYFDTIMYFEYENLNFYVALLFSIFSALIFISGFLAKPTITVISGLVLAIISIYNLVKLFDSGLTSSLSVFILIAGIAFYFLSSPSSK